MSASNAEGTNVENFVVAIVIIILIFEVCANYDSMVLLTILYLAETCTLRANYWSTIIMYDDDSFRVCWPY